MVTSGSPQLNLTTVPNDGSLGNNKERIVHGNVSQNDMLFKKLLDTNKYSGCVGKELIFSPLWKTFHV